MTRYIDADKLVEQLTNSPMFKDMGREEKYLLCTVLDIIEEQPTVDVVETDEIAKMLFELGTCPCNENGVDEWLPLYCDHKYTCDCSYMECWRQFVKHYKEREGDKDGKM